MADVGFIRDAGFDRPAVLIHVERGNGCDGFGGCVGAHDGCGGVAVVRGCASSSSSVGIAVVGSIGFGLDVRIACVIPTSHRARTVAVGSKDFLHAVGPRLRLTNHHTGIFDGRLIKGQNDNQCLILDVINHIIPDFNDGVFGNDSVFEVLVVLGGEHALGLYLTVGEDDAVARGGGGWDLVDFEDLDAWVESGVVVLTHHF